MPPGRRRGRPPGSRVPIRKSPSRFRFVFFEAFQLYFGFSAFGAGKGAVAFDEARFGVAVGKRGMSICAPFESPSININDNGMAGKAGGIARRRDQVRALASPDDLIWLDECSGYFCEWLHAAATGCGAVEDAALEELRRRDPKWPLVLRCAMDALAQAPMRVCAPGDREPLPRRLQWLLKMILRRRGKDLDEIFRAAFALRKSGKRTGERPAGAIGGPRVAVCRLRGRRAGFRPGTIAGLSRPREDKS